MRKNKKNTCLNCLKPCFNKFCCSECSCEYKKQQTMSKIADGTYTGFSNILIYKRYIIGLREHKCEICNNYEWMGMPIPLILDHINGKSSDNALDNIRLVCGNCDMQLPTYKSKNKNSDRKNRKGQW